CIWARAAGAADECCTGDDHVAHQERMARLSERGRRRGGAATGGAGESSLAAHLRESNQGARGDGGALAYLFVTPSGSIWWNDTSGYWTGVTRDVRPDVA